MAVFAVLAAVCSVGRRPVLSTLFLPFIGLRNGQRFDVGRLCGRQPAAWRTEEDTGRRQGFIIPPVFIELMIDNYERR